MTLDEDANVDRASEGLKAAMEDGFSKDGISFSVGFPPLETIPADTIRKRLNRLLRQPSQVAGLGYVPSEGDPALLHAVTNLLSKRGLRLGPDDKILITSGAQQGIALCLQALFSRGDTLAVESPGYMGLIANCRLRGIPMVPIPVDRRGLNPERLRTAAKKQELRGVYVVPNYQNPTGVVQSLKRRRQILDVADQHDMYIIEDDVYADLRFGGRSIAPMKSLPGGERVIYLSSFSKALAPGLRVGFLVASGPIVETLRRYKEADDISTGGLVQAVMTDLLESGFYERHTVKVRREYRRRRDAMLNALLTHLAKPWIKITRPRGGMHLWVMFKKNLDIESLLLRCRAAGVSFAPGYLFFADARKASSLRLNFSSHHADVIEEGVRRLARSIAKEEES
jgi:GntR family transcriptional regulator/MocR family aminotransferase